MKGALYILPEFETAADGDLFRDYFKLESIRDPSTILVGMDQRDASATSMRRVLYYAGWDLARNLRVGVPTNGAKSYVHQLMAVANLHYAPVSIVQRGPVDWGWLGDLRRNYLCVPSIAVLDCQSARELTC